MKKRGKIVCVNDMYEDDERGLAGPSYIVKEEDGCYEYIPTVGFNGASHDVYYSKANKKKIRL